METYRSGHNGPDSKSGSLKGLVGSNPTVSAIILLIRLDIRSVKKIPSSTNLFFAFFQCGSLKELFQSV